MRKWLVVLIVVLASACGDSSTDSESAEPRATSATTETTSKPKPTEPEPTKPEADAQAQLACDHFRNVPGDIAAGVLTTEQVTMKFQEVYGTARRSETPGIAEGAQELLSSWNAGDLDGVRSGNKHLDAACKRVGH